MLLFISDLHLSPRSAGATRLFLDFLAGRARQAEALYILGDFFETWIGDDDLDDAFNRQIVTALRSASADGLAILIQHGNRDFLLGAGFADASGTTLLSDPYILSTPEWQFILSHGDALCTNDTDYMAFRHQGRSAGWQAAFLAKPLSERRAIAAHMRAESEAGKEEKRGEGKTYGDLAPGDTDDFLRQHGYATFIHGHTHQAATHHHIVDGIHVERWVLADWHEDCGECLVWDGETLSREKLT